MSSAIAGFLNYNPDFLAKSTIFAAYCAHGLLPISAKASSSVIDGIESGKHYWVLNEDKLKDVKMLEAIANNAISWYRNHDLVNQSTVFFDTLNCSHK